MKAEMLSRLETILENFSFTLSELGDANSIMNIIDFGIELGSYWLTIDTNEYWPNINI